MKDRLYFSADMRADERRTITRLTATIHARNRRLAQGIWESGRDLLQVQEAFGESGGFEVWLAAEFDWHRATAYRFMSVTLRFPDVSQIATFRASVLYLFSSASVPQEAVEEATRRAAAGEHITTKKACGIIERHKRKQRLRLHQAPGEQLSPEQEAEIARVTATEVVRRGLKQLRKARDEFESLEGPEAHGVVVAINAAIDLAQQAATGRAVCLRVA